MSTEPKNSWGGKRAGAGRPPGISGHARTLTQEAVERALEVSARYEKLLSKNTDELMHDVAYGMDWAEKANIPTRLKAIGMIHDRQSPRIQEGGIADTHGQPPAELPARRPHPEKVH